MIRCCRDHGYYDASQHAGCPDCGEWGEEVLSQERRVRISKLMSGALRHFPGDLGLGVGPGGWVDLEALRDAVLDRYGWATAERVSAVIETDPKERFEVAGGRLRATYGHSIDVEITGDEDGIPELPLTARESRPSREARVFRHQSEPSAEQGGRESRKLR